MAVQSRSRPRKNSDSSAASAKISKHAHAPAAQKDRRSAQYQKSKPTSSLQHKLNDSTIASLNNNDDDEADTRPAKRRKLSIRSKQTNLDSFLHNSNQSTSSQPQPKPPTRVTLGQPHGRLLQNLNGVQTALDVNEDEISVPASGAATPLPKLKRVPKVQASALSEPAVKAEGSEKGKSEGKAEDKRTLRSADEGPRLKSELSIYFPNYEDIIFDAPKEAEFITVDSTLYVTEDAAKAKVEQTPSPKSTKGGKGSPQHARKVSTNGVAPTAASKSPTTPSKSSSKLLNGSPSLNLEIIARSLPAQPVDPLQDSHFLKAHRRAERKEKQLRNIEKERAMHEKVQLERILDGLQGHDWLKVLGITGITDSEAKKFEPKRDYFISEVKALVDKFRLWKEAERRLKVEKETPVPVKEEEEEEDGEEESDAPESGASSVGPPSSDLNASAARQLQDETASALKSYALSNSTAKLKPPLPPPLPPPPEEPIKSFYAKRHLREAALSTSRHRRTTSAFGHPVPELAVREFELPGDIGSEEAVRANAREKRRRKRERGVDASSAGGRAACAG